MRPLGWILVISLLVLAGSASADTTWVPAGNISGNWTVAGSPYMIHQGTVTVDDGDTLLIGPGVVVYFSGHYKFVVSGLMQAVGTQADSIRFTTDTLANPDRWWGIRFLYAHDSCRLEYCVIEWGRAEGDFPDFHGGGLYCDHSSPTLRYCTIRGNLANGGAGVSCFYSSPNFTDCAIIDNSAQFDGAGVYCWFSSPNFTNCTISDNSAEYYGGAIHLHYASSSVLTNCIITDNWAGDWGGGFYSYNCSAPTLTHCVFSGNATDGYGGGVFCDQSQVLVNNTIVAFTDGEGIHFNASSGTQVSHCDVFGNSGGDITFQFDNPSHGPPGIGQISTTNANGDSCDQYKNILLDPLFADAQGGDFHLTDYSPCLGAADPASAPPRDKDGNPRPNPPGSLPDIGACEHWLARPVRHLVMSITAGEVVVNWPSFAVFYNIYGSPEPFAQGTLLDSTTGTTWTDPDAPNRPSPYFYYVTAQQ